MNYKVFSEEQLEKLKMLSIIMQDIILDAYVAANIALVDTDKFFALCNIEIETIRELRSRKSEEMGMRKE